MNEKPIGFLDSGVGGLPYFAWLRQKAPAERYAYVADRANFPYGEKTKEAVLDIVESTARKLIERTDPKILIVACNTASVVALERLRERFSIPIVGTVPAIKPAAARSRRKRIGLLATMRTVNDAYVDRLVEQFASDCEVVRIAGPDIVSFVEKRFFDSGTEEKLAIVRDAVAEFGRASVDEIVLACTHFLYLADEIRELAGPGVEVMDSREGVGSRALAVLGENGRSGAVGVRGSAELFVTGSDPVEESYGKFADYFGMEIGGTLP
jgi:glutamate racemase